MWILIIYYFSNVCINKCSPKCVILLNDFKIINCLLDKSMKLCITVTLLLPLF